MLDSILHFGGQFQFSSVQFSHSVASDSLQPHELQHARPRCPSPTPGVHSDSRPSSQWCHPAISSSVVPFSSCPQSLPASESFPMSQLLVATSTGASYPRGNHYSDLYHSGLVFIYVEPHENGIMQYIAFCIWSLPCNIMTLSLTCVVCFNSFQKNLHWSIAD